MLMTENEKKWLAELDRRKRKIIEEEQIRLNDFNADQQRLLIFSHIFKIAPKLKRLSKRIRRKLKLRAMRFHLHQRIANENKIALENAQNIQNAQNTQTEKDKHQKSNVHLTLFHNDKSRYMQKRVSDSLLRTYVANLKKRT